MSNGVDAEDQDEAVPGLHTGLMGLLYRHRRLLSVLGAGWFVFILAGGVFLSQLGAQYGLHVFGTERWQAGEPGALRVALQQLRHNSRVPVGAVHATFIDAAGVREPEQILTGRSGDFAQGALLAPSRPGSYTVELTAQGPDIELVARFKAEVEPRSLYGAFPPGPTVVPPKHDTGATRLSLRPADHVLPGGLPTRLHVRATTAGGQPVSTQVRLLPDRNLNPGANGGAATVIPDTVQTDAHGLAAFAFQPIHPRFGFELQSADGSSATRQLKMVATQFVLEGPVLVKPGQRLTLGARALHRAGPMFVDLWQGDRWIAAETLELDNRSGALSFTLPALPSPALIWVQIYKSAYLPQDARGGRWILVSADDPLTATRWLANRMASAGIDQDYASWAASASTTDDRLLRHLLGRLGRSQSSPALLTDSSVSARQTVVTMKQRWQRRFVVALVVTGLMVFALLFWLIWRGSKDLEARWEAAGGTDEGELGSRRHAMRDASYIFVVLAAFLLGLIQLMMAVEW